MEIGSEAGALAHARQRYRTVTLEVSTDKVCPTTGKKQYESRLLAEGELSTVRAMRIAKKRRHVERKAYLCASCTKFHLSSW